MLFFGYDMNGEVLVLDRTTGKIFQLPHENTTTLKVPVKASVKLAETQEESKNEDRNSLQDHHEFLKLKEIFHLIFFSDFITRRVCNPSLNIAIIK